MQTQEKPVTPFELLLALRDIENPKMAKSRLALMVALICRCSPNRFHCWPSYERLSKDTKLTVESLRQAVADLEKMGYVKRKARPRSSNTFHINSKRILEEARVTRLAAMQFSEPQEEPFDFEAEASTFTEDQQAVAKVLLQVLQQFMPAHPALQTAEGTGQIENTLLACLPHAEDEFHLQSTVVGVIEHMSDREFSTLSETKNLSAYLAKHVPAWLAAFPAQAA